MKGETDVYQDITYSVQDPVATITLNRPDRLNAWTPAMDLEVRHAVERAEADPEVVGIVITGAGRAFCAGADMTSLTDVIDGPVAGHDTESDPEGFTAVSDTGDLAGQYTYLLACSKPIVAAINGTIAGMAVPVALCCDIRFMAEDGVLVTAFAQRGLVAELGISWLLPRLVGPAVALDLLLSSRHVLGIEAAQLGVVNAAMPAEEVVPCAVRYIEDLAARCSPRSMATMKRQVYEQLHVGLREAERESHRLMEASFSHPDFEEGVRSFIHKRSPEFRRLGGKVVDPS